ncbi:hypothetical protein INTERNEXUS_133 [Bacillus phage vB_BspM_Internexus]|nr:hypothetical protein INTERNEXUS_133 [Bacillus phage vB_BspM_Internexus]
MRESRIVACKISTSISSLIGNITGYARYFLSTKFPPDFFKDTHISGALNEIRMENVDIAKLRKPTLIMTPEYNGETGFMELLPNWHTTQYFTFKNPRKKYNGVLYDNKNDIYIYSIPDRIKVNFNIKIKLPSELYAYDVLHYVKQTFETGGYFYLNDVSLQTELPKMYTKIIEKKLNLDPSKPDDREKLEEYYLANSYNGITEKINQSSGNSQYAYTYKTNILVNIPELPTYEKNENGLITDSTTVNFPFSFELWSHSNYIMETKDDPIIDTISSEPTIEGRTMKYDFFLPTHFIKEQYDSMHLIVHKQFLPDINTEVDILDFSPLINSELRGVIEEALKQKLDMSKLLKARVLVDNKEIYEELFNVDWKTLNLITKEPMYNMTYTLMIYGDLKILNLISKYIAEGTKEKISEIEL